jgi:arylsulfatase A-like enzyme
MKQSIERRRFFKLLATGAATVSMPRFASAGSPANESPNVLIIQPDQHRGPIMGCAGDTQIQTPNLDRLAAEGIRFSRVASASPVCSPFRGTLQTGLYPHKHGVEKNDVRVNLEKTGIAEVFAEAGYATGYIGKWHLDGGMPKKEGGEGLTPKGVGGFVPPERRLGWREWQGYEKAHEYFEVWKYDEQGKKHRVEGYDWEPTWQTDTALDFIRRNETEECPWLYYIAYGPPHVPPQCIDRFLSMYDPEQFVFPPDVAGRLSPEREEELRQIWRMYYAQVTAIDHEIGRLLQGLRDLGADRNTIILYTSDHGDRLGSHAGSQGKLRGKGSPHANAFRIPLIVRWPGQIPPGQVCDALAGSVDLAPTILDLAGLPPIEGMQGQSMAGWCVNGAGPRHEAIWIGLGDWRAAWDGRWLYARGGKYRLLYDHETDPHEMNNLFDDSSYAKTRMRMHRLLVELAEKAEDPLLAKLRTMEI